ncbi:RNA-guided endonuclease IscB [Planktothrix pseudagardhii]|uniref:Restriction endonuclease n=1 Tax=Planktothrix pseudagardhii TaxID=132604 RepID=A0A9W4G914_9CYAN|nr:RNA-guided endonuclease IscB [Planktothrix pseudagardhii]CAD5971538.1 Restriction endonuclease [Planktothrix pseudagardhii]
MSKQNYVLVLDQHKKPLSPCRPVTARKLLKAKKAVVFRLFPFTIILRKVVKETPEPMTIKLDPGSKTTGIALNQSDKVVWGAELTHRGQVIKASLESRRLLRRSRRNRKTRYRQPRFLNRKRSEGWLAPSLQHRVETTLTWVNKLIRLAPIGSIVQELIRFDLQKLENPEISGIEYKQGELQGYEVREYLLEKWQRKCAYCGVENVSFEVEHIHPKSKGGTDRISNLAIACHNCNQEKGNRDIRDFLSGKPDLLNRILKQAKSPLKDATAVNSTRWVLFNKLKEMGLPISTGSGGLTKFNRTRLNLPKTHWIDASCVGQIESLTLVTNQPILIKATGRGTRQMCGTDKYGFPTRHRSRIQIHKGFQTGDIIKATVTAGKKVGFYLGRVLCRASGSFDISTQNGRITGISYKYCQSIHKKDGYSYGFQKY